jgi:TolB-like protein
MRPHPPLRLPLIAATALLLLTLLATLAWAQADLRSVADTLVKQMVEDVDVAPLKGQRLFIAEFKNINGRGDAVTLIFQEMLTTASIRAKHFKVVERAQLEKALKELKISATGLMDPEDAKKLGKMLGAGYMIVGSVSEERGTVSVDARLVAIETGESVTAAYATLKGEAAAATGGGSTTPSQPGTNKSPVDLNQPANPLPNTGTYLGKVENSGLLGGGRFKVAWREKLDGNIESFSAGNVTGDGFPRLVGVAGTIESYSYRGQRNAIVWKWNGQAFKRVWVSEAWEYLRNNPICVRTGSISGKDSFFCNGQHFVWNGTAYAIPSVSDRIIDQADASRLLVGRLNDDRIVITALIEDEPIAQQIQNAKAARIRFTISDAYTACDFDGDGQLEVAHVESVRIGDNPKPIEIFSLEGIRKAVTQNGYSARLTHWKPAGVKYPYLVTRINEGTKEDDKVINSGGYVVLLQFDGESYEEIWKSDKLGEYVLDMQACDPKGEKDNGLVVLSQDKAGCWLTKFVAE